MNDQTLKFRLNRDAKVFLHNTGSSQSIMAYSSFPCHGSPKTNAIAESESAGSEGNGSSGCSSSTTGTPPCTCCIENTLARTKDHVQGSPSTSLHWRDGFDHHQAPLRLRLWKAKNLFNAVCDEDYIAARNRIFPLAKSGGDPKQFFNRAGYKLAEVMDAVAIWDHLRSRVENRMEQKVKYEMETKRTKPETIEPDEVPRKFPASAQAGQQPTEEQHNDAVAVSFGGLPSMAVFSGISSSESVTLPKPSRAGYRWKTSSVANALALLMAEEKKAEQLRQHRKEEETPLKLLRKRKHNAQKGSASTTITFADLCGGPGAFSQYLLSEGRRQRLCIRGYGMTLGGVEGLDWYPELVRQRGASSSSRCSPFVVTYGPDGTGSIFNLPNVDGLVSIAGANKVALVVGDGGFHVEKELQNYQETISSRITYAQWMTALKLQSVGGCFVLKLFDTFSLFTRAMLYLSTFMYRQVWIVKPQHSRVTNSERYLVCIDFIPNNLSVDWMPHLEQCFLNGFENDEYCVPTILLSPEVISRDEVFMKDLYEMNHAIASRQLEGLEGIWEELQR